MSNTRMTFCLITLICIVAIDGPLIAAPIQPLGIIAANRCDGIEVLDADPNQIVVTALHSESQPATAWKITMNPGTGDVDSFVQKQTLSGTSDTGAVIFESANGTLFTGAGWLGVHYPFRSVDGGESWQATTGDPRWGTYDFAEFNGEIYDVTGYSTSYNKVHRYNVATNAWESVFQIDAPRRMARALSVHNGEMFVGTTTYAVGSGGVPVYLTSDGVNFTPTVGIADDLSVEQLLVVNNVPLASVYDNSSNRYLYEWDGAQWQYRNSRLNGAGSFKVMTTDALGRLYDFGTQTGDAGTGLYRSSDLGLHWERIADYDGPVPTVTDLHGNWLYFGTTYDDVEGVHVYRTQIPEPATLTLMLISAATLIRRRCPS